MQVYLAQSSFGRVLLHLACACHDHKYRWHWLGIRRELTIVPLSGTVPRADARARRNEQTAAIMKINKRTTRTLAFAILSFALMNRRAHAVEPQTLFNFQVGQGTVAGALVQGPDGNFYGTTVRGGLSGIGSIFRVTPAGVLTTLASDQPSPAASLAVGRDGLLYGLTANGGTAGLGTAFKLTTNGVLTTLAQFNGVNAANPTSGLVLAGDGNFYGVSPNGGVNSFGSVFRVTPAGVVTTLVSFGLTPDGGIPRAGLTLGPDGNLYGINTSGGSNSLGTIFRITTGGAVTTLHAFQAAEGFVRQARLTVGPDGDLYATSSDGGSADKGTVFRI